MKLEDALIDGHLLHYIHKTPRGPTTSRSPWRVALHHGPLKIPPNCFAEALRLNGRTNTNRATELKSIWYGASLLWIIPPTPAGLGLQWHPHWNLTWKDPMGEEPSRLTKDHRRRGERRKQMAFLINGLRLFGTNKWWDHMHLLVTVQDLWLRIV